MNALLLAGMRRHWRLIGAIAAFIIFTSIHLAFFRPAAARYRAALASVGGIEAVFNPGGAHPMLPPRVYALITENTLPAQEALERGGSGALGVILLEDLGRIANRCGLEVAKSEPGPVTQVPITAQIRAHVTLRGRFGQLVAFFDELSRSQSLLIVERFQITPTDDGGDLLEIWVSRLYLKQAGGRP